VLFLVHALAHVPFRSLFQRCTPDQLFAQRLEFGELRRAFLRATAGLAGLVMRFVQVRPVRLRNYWD
jgi:hypothetical protein